MTACTCFKKLCESGRKKMRKDKINVHTVQLTDKRNWRKKTQNSKAAGHSAKAETK